MKVLRRLITVVIVIALAAGGYWVYRGRGASATKAQATAGLSQVVTVKQGNLSTNLTVVGQLEALQSQDMAFSRMNRAAKLVKLNAKAGNTVKAGQVLATIDPAPYQQALDQANSDLQAAQQKLADLKTPVTKLSIAKADLAVAKGQLQIQQAQNDLDNLVSPDMTALQAAVTDADRAYAQAQVDLAALQDDPTTATNLTKLRDTEAKASAQYTRLATETTPSTDTSYDDRLLVALNALKTAEDARITAETQQQANILKAQMAVTKAKNTLADAQDALATAQAGGDKLALAKAQVAVQNAQVSLAVAQDARTTLDAGTDATTLAAAQADVDKKQLAVTNAQADLAATTLVAPFDGTVLQVQVAQGDLIAAATQILTMADMKALQVVASVDETTIRQVKTGQNATMTFDAVAGQTFRGKVVSVPLQGALQSNVMVYEVPVSLTGAESAPLLVGMTANVQILVGQAANALLVPALAVQQVNGAYQVLVPNEDPQGQPKVVPVEVGLSDGVNTQIVRGLNVGDKVLVQYQTTSTTGNQKNQNIQFQGGPPPDFQGGPPVIVKPGP